MRLTAILLLVVASVRGQNSSGHLTAVPTPETYSHGRNIHGGLKLESDIDAGDVILRLAVSPEYPGAIIPILESKVSTNSDALVELFYWKTVETSGKFAQTMRYLLHKSLPCPLVQDIEVLCDHISMSMSDVEFVRVRLMSQQSEVEIWKDDFIGKVKVKAGQKQCFNITGAAVDCSGPSPVNQHLSP